MSAISTAKTSFGIYRILGLRCGCRVSLLRLGTTGLNETRSSFIGTTAEEEALKLSVIFWRELGQHIHRLPRSAEQYMAEEVERLEQHGNRDQLVVTTKYSMSHKQDEITRPDHTIGANYSGNDTKFHRLFLRDSPRKLLIDCIDILCVHWYDYTSEELMRSLDAVVKVGKILRLGIPDAPAWKANPYAKFHPSHPL
ncbi:hypothetical protein F5146DRAFT_643833 [Armillaria mellea]|nr:hypothetical protein F5146DRAFT_643833 [Armillaria mellea]